MNAVNIINQLKNYTQASEVYLEAYDALHPTHTSHVYTSHDRPTVHSVILHIRSSEVDSGRILTLTLSEDTLDTTLRTTLESIDFIVYSMDSTLSLLLLFNVRLKIKYSIELMKLITNTITPANKGVGSLNMDLLSKLDMDYYTKLHCVSELLVYTNYMNLLNDIDLPQFNAIKHEACIVADSIKSKWLTDYNTDICSAASLKSTLVNKFGINLTSTSRRSLKECDNEITSEIIKFNTNLKISKIKLRPFYFFLTDACIKSSFPNLIYEFRGAIKADCSKFYYINISPVQAKLKLAYGNLPDENIDLHSLAAASLFNIPLGEVSRQARMVGKALNFVNVFQRDPAKLDYIYALANHFNINSIDSHISLLTDSQNDLINSQLFRIIISGLYNVSSLLKSARYTPFEFRLHSAEHDTFTFKVSNKINPYRALKLLSDAFDTSETLGYRLFTTCGIGNTYAELHETSALRFGHNDLSTLVGNINYKFIDFMYNRISKEKLRNVCNSVLSDLQVYMQSGN